MSSGIFRPGANGRPKDFYYEIKKKKPMNYIFNFNNIYIKNN